MTPRVIGEAYGLELRRRRSTFRANSPVLTLGRRKHGYDRRQHFSSLLGQVQMRRLPGLTTQIFNTEAVSIMRDALGLPAATDIELPTAKPRTKSANKKKGV